MNDTVLVIGATGQQGGATARALLARGRKVHALVRDPDRPAARALASAGAALVVGDLDDRESLRAAMSEVHGVFLVLSMMDGSRVSAEGVVAEVRRGRAVAEVAAETGVGHLVYSSVAGADQDTGIPHVESKGLIEAHIRTLGLPATIVRPAFFMENFATHTKPAMVDGELVVGLALRPDTPLQLIATRDIGALAALAFDRPWDRPVVLAGDRLTGAEIADRFAKARGVPARFEQVPLDRLRAFDPEVARMFAWFDSRAGERADIPALRASHPGLSTMDDWLVDA
ncbi:MAG: NAD(P)H-binding protein [Actinophytocola sp.]|uniref:NmrA/HSCARG family protein n=1 Tax=Actinophytocola sp. TaxID=1872138 RepID=UPI001328746C|nr:NmrA/HSCARG family protein [Actinophytocola sp.]MPZ86341.1 NAD(P)H-binding protein [Actinophytocola sp.]